MSVSIQEVLRAGALNGETPIWDDSSACLLWVDVRKPSLHAFDPKTKTDREWEMPAWIGCYGLADQGLVVALRTGLFGFDPKTGALEFLAPPPYDPRRFTFNDGRIDPAGRFLAGTMYVPLKPGDQQKERGHGTPLWRLEPGRTWAPRTQDVHTSNGLAWSPDGRRLYHSDTMRQKIWAWDYDPDSGDMTGRRTFVQLQDLPDGTGPDGASVDGEGFYWCAIYGCGRLHRYDPDGRLEREVVLPIRYPTMPAFGGADLDVIYVTSANWQLDPAERRKAPMEGSILALPAPVSGLPTSRMIPPKPKDGQ